MRPSGLAVLQALADSLYNVLADYPVLPGVFIMPVFYQTGKGMNELK
jgi:hypothetical protein